MKLSKLIAAIALLVTSQLAVADTLFRNATIVTAGTADSAVADVLVAGGKISRIGEGLDAGEGVDVVDASGKVLTAGFFNSNTELGLREVDAVASTVDSGTENSRITASLRASDAINPSSILFPHNRMLGITHAMVAPDAETGLFAGTASIIRLSETDTIVDTAAGMIVMMGTGGQAIAGGSRAAAMAMLREAFEDARDYRANRDSFNRGNRREYQLSRHDLAALIPVVERKMPLIAYVDSAVDIERMLGFAKQNRIDLIIAGAMEGWRVAEQLAKAKIPVIMDPINNLPSGYATLGARLDNAKLLHEAGVTLMFTGMGWHNTHNAYLVRQSAGNAVANGLPYDAAIAAVTSNPANVFGLTNVGQVKVGYAANLVLWSADPLEPSTIVEKVLLNGIDQPLVSRATRLRDRYYSRLRNGQ